MKRIVQPELLDALPPDDPNAVRSRRDLRRVNAWMRNHVIMARALKGNANGHVPNQIVDLGAGDGHFLLQVARLAFGNGAPNFSSGHSQANATLLDQKRSVAAPTLSAFTELGWQAEAVVADVFEWSRTGQGKPDVIVANLFLHHFTEAQLTELFPALAGRTQLFIAVEPRRAAWPLFCSRSLWAIGCNAVTQHDAMVSVRAGFIGRELSALWPSNNIWRLTEQPAGSFSHLFVAQRIG